MNVNAMPPGPTHDDSGNTRRQSDDIAHTISTTLLRGLRATDPESEEFRGSFHRFCLEFSEIIYQQCMKTIRNPDTAVDICHSLLLEIGKKIRSFSYETEGEKPRSFLKWLSAVTRNAIHDYYRVLGKSPRPIGDASEGIVDPSPDHTDPLGDDIMKAIDREFRRRAVREVLEEARDIDRQIMERMFPGLAEWQFEQKRSGDEVADELNLTRANVYQRKRRLIQKMQERYEHIRESSYDDMLGDAGLCGT